jgi:hypothetical protein
MEEVEDHPLVKIPHMPHRLDQRVQLEVAAQLCHFMTSHRVVPTPIRDILRVHNIFTIWRIFPHDMTLLMRHIFSVINLIEKLKGDAHDPTTSHSLAYPSTSSTPPHDPPPSPDSPPHESNKPYIDTLASPPHVSKPASMYDPRPSPPPSPPHVSEFSSMSDPPPPAFPPHVSETASTSSRPPSYPTHVYEHASMSDPPPPPASPPYASPYSIYPPPLPPTSPPHASSYSIDPPPPPPPPLVSPSIYYCLSPSPHVSSSIDPPPPPPFPPYVSRDFNSLDTMFTSGTTTHIRDIDRETFDSALFSTFIYEIVVLDRGSTSSSREIDAPSSGGGTS